MSANRLITVCIGLAVTITLKPILITALQNDGQQNGAKDDQSKQQNKAPVVKKQDKAADKTKSGTDPQQQTPPARITIDGPVTVSSQPDPNQKQREADQKAQTHFQNSIQVATLIFVGIAAFGAVAAYFASRRQANAAEESLREMRRQIVVTQRPWIYVRAKISEDIAFDEERNAKIPVVFTARNFGHTPASVYVAAEVINLYVAEGRSRDIMAGQARLCENAKDANIPRIMVFPGQEVIVSNLSLPLSKEEIAKSPSMRIFSPVIYGCADYSFDLSPVHHQTGFVYIVSEHRETEPNAVFLLNTLQDIPSKTLKLSAYPIGFFAD
jgi:hypothetical protein